MPTLIGTRQRRVDGPDKLTGAALFTADIVRPGMLHARMLRSPHPHARVLAVDLTPALAMPGVRAGVIVSDLPRVDAARPDTARPDTARPDGARPDQARSDAAFKVFYEGDEVAAIAADTEAQARDAVRAIRVRYEVLPHLATVDEAMRVEAPMVFEGGNVRTAPVESEGNLEDGRRASVEVVEATYTTQVQTHVCPETHGCVCEWTGDHLTMWVTTQAVHATREQVARALRLPPGNVRVVAEHIGGAFGSKFGPDVQGMACARLARLAGHPVRLMLDRNEEHLATGNRPSAHAKLAAGVAADGKLMFLDAETWGTGGAGATAAFPLPYVYVFPNRRRLHRDVFINAGRQRPMRAPGHPQGCFITEALVDELADRVKMDPVAFRLANLPPAGPGAMWARCFQIAADRFGWVRRHATGDNTPGPIKRGMGCAVNRWGGGGRGSRVQCQIQPDGRVVVRCGTQDLGTGIRTLVALVAADTLGLALDAVHVDIGDSQLPFSGGSGGSTTTASVTPAVRVTVLRALDALLARVAPRFGVKNAALLTASKGRVHHVANEARGVSWAAACKLLGTAPVTVEGEWEAGLSGSGTSGVQMADVEVDIDTGITTVTRIVCVQECGLVLDRLTAESQTMGGIVMGLGYALFEDRILDRHTAQMVNPDMEWYLLPGISDVPDIDVQFLAFPERGAIGLGEPPTIATAAAIANAVRNATGVSVRQLPVTPERVLNAIERVRSGGTM